MSPATLEHDTALGTLPERVVELPGRRHGWLEDLRAEARCLLASGGFPARRDESWKYTDPAVVTAPEYVVGDAAIATGDLPDLGIDDAHRLVLVDGRLDAASSSVGDLPEGVVVSGLAGALDRWPERVRSRLGTLAGGDADGFVALNTAVFTDGAFVDVPEGVELDRPVLVIHRAIGAGGPRAANVRHLLAVGARGGATVVTAHVGDGAGTTFTNVVTEAHVGSEARLDHVQVDLGELGSHLIDRQIFHVGRSARARTRHACLGRGWVRGDLRAVLAGEGADLLMNGLALATGRRHVDFFTTIDHAMPHGHSAELFKTVADEGSTGVFRGRIVVREDAQHTDANQTNRNLLLSEGAKVWTRPQLEIYADDVRCTHGATIGRIDEEGLFYLRTRGISADEARRMLLTAFAAEVLDDVPHEGLRVNLRERLERRLPAGEELAG